MNRELPWGKGEQTTSQAIQSQGWPEHCDDPTWLSEATDVDGM